MWYTEEQENSGPSLRAPEMRNFMAWYEKSVFYQIYPLGFCGAPWQNDGVTEDRILKVMDLSLIHILRPVLGPRP